MMILLSYFRNERRSRKSDFYVINDYTFLFSSVSKIKKDLTMKLREFDDNFDDNSALLRFLETKKHSIR